MIIRLHVINNVSCGIVQNRFDHLLLIIWIFMLYSFSIALLFALRTSPICSVSIYREILEYQQEETRVSSYNNRSIDE